MPELLELPSKFECLKDELEEARITDPKYAKRLELIIAIDQIKGDLMNDNSKEAAFLIKIRCLSQELEEAKKTDPEYAKKLQFILNLERTMYLFSKFWGYFLDILEIFLGPFPKDGKMPKY